MYIPMLSGLALAGGGLARVAPTPEIQTPGTAEQQPRQTTITIRCFAPLTTVASKSVPFRASVPALVESQTN